MIVTTLALVVSLRRHYGPHLRMVSGGAEPTREENYRAFSPGVPAEPAVRLIGRLAATNLGLGLLVMLDLVVLLYLHVLSHVGAAAS